MAKQTSAAVAAPSASAWPQWLKIARSYIGTLEAPGARDNPRVVELYALAGHPEIKHDAVPWCAAFVGACLRKAGLPSTGTLWALDYARYGERLARPAVGAIATKKRNGGGHVAFVVDYDLTRVWLLGGNQGDAVNISVYPRVLMHSYSWPPGVPQPTDRRAGAFRVGSVKAGSEA